jgi:ABC-type Zn uptake system ZnuABC Zn-binding protein ZnuA
MKKLLILISAIAAFGFGEVDIVTSTTDLASIATIIGGDQVKVTSIARGNQNPHYVEVLPSYMLKVKKADIYFKVGMELDLWSERIISGSRNKNLVIVDCSSNINPVEIPTEKVDAGMGDIHRFGNPHYWLDPLNGKIIAQTIAESLIQVDPENRILYETNLNRFNSKIDDSLKRWQSEYKFLQGQKLIFYHNSWPYFTNRFGLKTVAFVEPKPGIIPSPAHLDKLIDLIESDNIQIIAMEPYFSDKAPKFLKSKTGINIVLVAPSVGALNGTNTYFELIEYNLLALNNIVGNNHD